jgi:hypothetical protein
LAVPVFLHVHQVCIQIILSKNAINVIQLVKNVLELTVINVIHAQEDYLNIKENVISIVQSLR